MLRVKIEKVVVSMSQRRRIGGGGGEGATPGSVLGITTGSAWVLICGAGITLELIVNKKMPYLVYNLSSLEKEILKFSL